MKENHALDSQKARTTLGWNGKLPQVVRKKIIGGRAEARSLPIIFGYNKTFEILKEMS